MWDAKLKRKWDNQAVLDYAVSQASDVYNDAFNDALKKLIRMRITMHLKKVLR